MSSPQHNIRHRKNNPDNATKIIDTTPLDAIHNRENQPLNTQNNTNSGQNSIRNSSKSSNILKRVISTVVLFLIFFLVIYIGPSAIIICIILVQIIAYNEIITIGYRIYKLYELPRFRTLSWYFLVCINYYAYGELIQDHLVGLQLFQRANPILAFFLKKHRMITYFMFVIGFVGFVLSLRKGYYAKQFFFFGWTVVSLLMVGMQSHCFVNNCMHGLIWIILPGCLVSMNDVMAYICGYFWPWQKTPLIDLSPKKTWEGFLGGAFFTIVASWFLGAYLAQINYLICPIEVSQSLSFQVETDCDIDPVFNVIDMAEVPLIFGSNILRTILGRTVIRMRLFQVHSCVIGLFASILGPFGGFFASGLKRGFKIKDFGDSIPGHGGFLDRFDCQYMCSTFTWVYLATFVRIPNVTRILHQASRMDLDNQFELLYKLAKNLAGKFTNDQNLQVVKALGL